MEHRHVEHTKSLWSPFILSIPERFFLQRLLSLPLCTFYSSFALCEFHAEMHHIQFWGFAWTHSMAHRPQKIDFLYLDLKSVNHFFLCRIRRWYVSVFLQVDFFVKHTPKYAPSDTIFASFLVSRGSDFSNHRRSPQFYSLDKYLRFDFVQNTYTHAHPTIFKKIFSFHLGIWCVSRSIQEIKLNEIKI